MSEEEGKINVSSKMSIEDIEDGAKFAKPKISREEYKRNQKNEAMGMAEYKKRLRESVELKELQVKELELNVRYYYARIEHENVGKLMQQNEEERVTKENELIAKLEAEREEAAKPNIQFVTSGKPRTEEEIEMNKKIVVVEE